MYKICKYRQKYGLTFTIVKFNKYVKYGQVALPYRARDHTAAVWCCLKYAVLHIFHKYEKNVIICMQNLGPKSESILMHLSPYVCSQVHIFVYVPVCLLAMVPQKGEQRRRRFLFCLQPAWLPVAAKYSNLFPPRICWCSVARKPSDSQKNYRRQCIQKQL